MRKSLKVCFNGLGVKKNKINTQNIVKRKLNNKLYFSYVVAFISCNTGSRISMLLIEPSSPQLNTIYGNSWCTQSLLQERSWRPITLRQMTSVLFRVYNATMPSRALDTICVPPCVLRNLV